MSWTRQQPVVAVTGGANFFERITMPNTFSGKGNLVDSPTLKTVPVNGKPRSVADMRIFFDEYGVNEDGEIEQTGGFYMSVSLWDKKGEEAQKHLRKGARVKVDGRLQQFMYKDKETGKELPAFQVIADDINLSLSRVEEIRFRPKRTQQQAEEASEASE